MALNAPNVKKKELLLYQDAHWGFTCGDETNTNMVKCNKIETENVGSDLQNDSSTDIVLLHRVQQSDHSVRCAG